VKTSRSPRAFAGSIVFRLISPLKGNPAVYLQEWRRPSRPKNVRMLDRTNDIAGSQRKWCYPTRQSRRMRWGAQLELTMEASGQKGCSVTTQRGEDGRA
jgi:hypothetical protein